MNAIPNSELYCSRCRWMELCGPEGVMRWLNKAGKIKKGRIPDPAIAYEIFRSSASNWTCPSCSTPGLYVRPAAEDVAEWGDPTPCTACGKIISPERLEAVPNATLCIACQNRIDQGLEPITQDYCPRCGSLMTVRQSRGAGLARFVQVCTNSSCRGR